MEAPGYCPLTDRIKSILIDALFMVAVMLVFSAVLDMVDKPPVWVRVTMFIVIWFLYEPFCVAYACTVGQYIMHIRVRLIANPSERINIVLSYLRYIIKLVFGWLSFLSVAFNQHRQAIHDLAVESIVVKV